MLIQGGMLFVNQLMIEIIWRFNNKGVNQGMSLLVFILPRKRSVDRLEGSIMIASLKWIRR